MCACVEPLFSWSRFLLWLNLCLEVGLVNQLSAFTFCAPDSGPQNGTRFGARAKQGTHHLWVRRPPFDLFFGAGLFCS